MPLALPYLEESPDDEYDRLVLGRGPKTRITTTDGLDKTTARCAACKEPSEVLTRSTDARWLCNRCQPGSLVTPAPDEVCSGCGKPI
jgi:hypothetical protein